MTILPRASTITIASGADSSSARNCAALAATASLVARRLSRLGIASALGISWTRRIAVGTDASAVTALTNPDSQYVGTHIVQISMTWVAPHAMMKIPKHTH